MDLAQGRAEVASIKPHMLLDASSHQGGYTVGRQSYLTSNVEGSIGGMLVASLHERADIFHIREMWPLG
jgi:hypothetical protein